MLPYGFLGRGAQSQRWMLKATTDPPRFCCHHRPDEQFPSPQPTLPEHSCPFAQVVSVLQVAIV